MDANVQNLFMLEPGSITTPPVYQFMMPNLYNPPRERLFKWKPSRPRRILINHVNLLSGGYPSDPVVANWMVGNPATLSEPHKESVMEAPTNENDTVRSKSIPLKLEET